MSYEMNVPQIISYEFDFDRDGGAIGAKVMRAAAVNKLKPGLAITAVVANVITPIVGGAATVGDGTTAAGFFTTLTAAAVGSYDGKGSKGGTLVSTANGDFVTVSGTVPTLTIATSAVTAGKIKVDFHCYQVVPQYPHPIELQS